MNEDCHELNIKFKPNLGLENRYLDILINSVTEKGQKISINIYVHQLSK